MIGFLYGIASVFIVLSWNFGGFAFLYWDQKKEKISFKKLGYLSLVCLAIAWLSLCILYIRIQDLHLKTIWVISVSILSSVLFIISAFKWWSLAKIIHQSHGDPKKKQMAFAAFLVFTISLILLIAIQFLIRFR